MQVIKFACINTFSLQVLELCGNHVSLYQLTVEHGTPLSKSVKNNEIVRF